MDNEPVRTPLAGIATALTANPIVAMESYPCVRPALSHGQVVGLAAGACSRFRRAGGNAAHIGRAGTRQPHIAVNVLHQLWDAIERGVRKVTDALTELRMEQLPEIDWKKHDPQGRALRNMNTLPDYKEARKSLETK